MKFLCKIESKILWNNTLNYKYPKDERNLIDNMQVNTKNTPIDSKNKSDKKFYITLICIFIFSILCNTFCFQLAQVNGSSMYPTMKDGQLLVISKLANKDEYQRGDIIIFKAHGKKLIERLIGLPGETIQIIDNDIYINGERTTGPYTIKVIGNKKYLESALTGKGRLVETAPTDGKEVSIESKNNIQIPKYNGELKVDNINLK